MMVHQWGFTTRSNFGGQKVYSEQRNGCPSGKSRCPKAPTVYIQTWSSPKRASRPKEETKDQKPKTKTKNKNKHPLPLSLPPHQFSSFISPHWGSRREAKTVKKPQRNATKKHRTSIFIQLTSLRFSEWRKRKKQPRNAVDSTPLHAGATAGGLPPGRKNFSVPWKVLRRAVLGVSPLGAGAMWAGGGGGTGTKMTSPLVSAAGGRHLGQWPPPRWGGAGRFCLQNDPQSSAFTPRA